MKPLATLMLVIVSTLCQAECPIECFCDWVTTTCSGNNLLRIFPQVYGESESRSSASVSSPLTTRLKLVDYSVKHLGRQDFLQIISNLTELSISRNSLETFDNDTFSRELSPSAQTGKGVTSTDIIFSRGTSLGVESQIEKSESEESAGASAEQAGYYSGVLVLQILDLSANKLRYFVGGGKLANLRSLDLSGNGLQQVYALSALEKLESVNLRNNRIQYLERNIFQNLGNLEYVNLDSNILGFVDPSTFSNLPALAHLILSSNPISHNFVQGALLYWNSRVQFVDVSNTGLAWIPPTVTKTIRQFRSARNNLTVVRQTDFESYPNLAILELEENGIQVVEDDAFGRLEFLERLKLSGNRLTKVPQMLPPSLRVVLLERNQIVNVSCADFKNLKRVETLTLSENQISSLSPFVFSELTSLKRLDLKENFIDVIYRDTFANLSQLESLDISGNPVKVIVTRAFEIFGKLTHLHLSRLREPIELDVTTFQSFSSVKYLELQESPNLTQALFENRAFSYFPGLVTLNVQNCNLEDVNLVANALHEVNLDGVKLAGNLWNCENISECRVVHELITRHVITDGPKCSRPSDLANVPLASLNFSWATALPSTREVTSSLPSAATQQFIGTSVPTTRKGQTELMTRFSSSKSTVTSRIKNAEKVTDGVKAQATGPNLKILSSKKMTHLKAPPLLMSTASSSRKILTSTKLPSGIEHMLESDFDIVPTQSYFDYPTQRKSGDKREKVEETTANEKGSLRTAPAKVASSEAQTKTNDDNAIIDESRLPRISGRGKEDEQQEENDVDGGEEQQQKQKQRSIDGFPLAYPPKKDKVSKGMGNSGNSGADPKYSYLKLNDNISFQGRTNLKGDGEENFGIIVKTLVISALTCLGSVLGLFLVIFAIYRYTWKRNRRSFSCGRICSQEEGYCVQDSSEGIIYNRFDQETSHFPGHAISHQPQIYHRDLPPDQVEMNGFSNRVYFETEDIFHIT